MRSTQRSGRSTRRSGRGRGNLPVGRELSGGPPGGAGEVRRAILRFRRGQVSYSEVHKAHPEVWGSRVGREGSGVPPGGLGGVRRPSQRFGRGQEVLPQVWERWRGPPGGAGGVERPYRRSGRPTRRFGWVWNAHPEVREVS